jgi:hypothetical protein
MDIRESITIARPIADVWAFFQVPRNNFAWQADLLGQTMVRMSPELLGRVGREWRKRTGESTWEVIECTTDRTIGFKSLSSPVPYRGAYRFEPAQDGTRFIYEFHMDPPILWRLAAPVVKTVARKQLRINLARLKAMLEM